VDIVTVPGGLSNSSFTLAQVQASLQNRTYTFNLVGNSYIVTTGAPVAAVPEPWTWMMGLGLVGAVIVGRRRKRVAAIMAS